MLSSSSRNSPLDRRALLLAGAGAAASAPLLVFEPAAAGRSRTKVMKGHFEPGVKDWVYRPFTVPPGVREIEVKYTYNPTNVGPTTVNVVDIGIFGPAGTDLGNAEGFRGWSGGSRRSFKLSRTEATPGYLPGPITPGQWKIALGPYQITTPGTPYRVTVTLHFGKKGPFFEPAPAPTAVAETGAGWYRGDLHVHTVHSDGSQTQAEVLEYAAAAGLDFIGTSEHNTSSAMGTWGRYVPEDFLVIPGEEVTTRYGHWLATGVPNGTWIDWRYTPDQDVLGQFTQQVRDLGGLSIACHPRQAGTGIGWKFDRYLFTDMDAIEVWNGPWTVDDDDAVSDWHKLLTKGVFKPAVGNSDTHKQSQTIGLPQTVVRSDGLSVEPIIGGYRRGNSWIAESSAVELVDFSARNDDVSGQCGDRVPADPGQPVDVRFEMTGVDGCVATLYGPGTANVLGTAAAVDGRIELDATVTDQAFVRAEVRRGPLPTDAMVALTNPIFLTAVS